jgi:hypothetical protein
MVSGTISENNGFENDEGELLSIGTLRTDGTPGFREGRGQRSQGIPIDRARTCVDM